MAALLPAIWTAALALAAFASATMAALIAARIRRERVEHDSPHRRARISKALLQYALAGGERPSFALGDRRERAILVETAFDAAAIMRGPGRQRLVDFLRDIGLDRRLRRQALSPRLNERLAALEALRLFPGAETMAVLRAVERSSDLRVCLASLRTQTELGEGPGLERLLEVAARPAARRSRPLSELVAARAGANLPEALAAFANVSSRDARVLLARALGESKDGAAFAALKQAAQDHDPEVRAAVAGALGALGVNAAVPLLAVATEDDHWVVRLKAAEALGRLGASGGAHCLERLLEDEVWWVRFRADQALSKLREAAARKAQRKSASQRRRERQEKIRAPRSAGLES